MHGSLSLIQAVEQAVNLVERQTCEVVAGGDARGQIDVEGEIGLTAIRSPTAFAEIVLALRYVPVDLRDLEGDGANVESVVEPQVRLREDASVEKRIGGQRGYSGRLPALLNLAMDLANSRRAESQLATGIATKRQRIGLDSNGFSLMPPR